MIQISEIKIARLNSNRQKLLTLEKIMNAKKISNSDYHLARHHYTLCFDIVTRDITEISNELTKMLKEISE